MGYLSVDDYMELIYCDLKRYHFRRGEPRRIQSVFQRCQSRIADDLGFALNNSTPSRYLETTNRSFDEISYGLGYKNSVSLRKIFVKWVSLLPLECREKFQSYR